MEQLPAYSQTCSLTRPATTSSVYTRSQSQAEYVYQTKNLSLNLGRRVWGTQLPCYGFNDTITGSLTLLSCLQNVTNITVSLQGWIVTTTSERGHVTGSNKSPIFEKSVHISHGQRPNWVRRHNISIPFPTYVSGGNNQLPPTFVTYQAGVTCEIYYVLRVDYSQKGFRRHDRIKTNVLYVPKSYCSSILPSLPDTTVRCVRVPPKSTATTKPAEPDIPELQLTLHSAQSYPSTLPIPVALRLVSLRTPAIAALLALSADIALIKRISVMSKQGAKVQRSVRESLVGTFQNKHVDNSNEGVTVVSGELRLVASQLETSWRMEGHVCQSYFVRTVVRPPTNIANHVPTYEHSEPVSLATDPGDVDREIEDVTTPALGLLTFSPRSCLPLRRVETTI